MNKNKYLVTTDKLTFMVTLQHQIVGLFPQVLARAQICKVLVLFGHCVVHVHGDEHAKCGGLCGDRRTSDRDTTATTSIHATAAAAATTSDRQLSAAVTRRLASNGTHRSGGGRRGRQWGRRALTPQRLI